MNFDDFDEGEFFEGNEANYFSDDERGIMENKKEGCFKASLFMAHLKICNFQTLMTVTRKFLNRCGKSLPKRRLQNKRGSLRAQDQS